MIHKFALKSDKEYFYITFIGREYRIDRKNGYLEWSEDVFATCTEGDFNEALTIYDLLCDSMEYCIASGEYINLRSLSAIQGSAKNLGDDLGEREDKIFDHKDELFCRVCENPGCGFKTVRLEEYTGRGICTTGNDQRIVEEARDTFGYSVSIFGKNIICEIKRADFCV